MIYLLIPQHINPVNNDKTAPNFASDCSLEPSGKARSATNSATVRPKPAMSAIMMMCLRRTPSGACKW